jgi:hypothetical protein
MTRQHQLLLGLLTITLLLGVGGAAWWWYPRLQLLPFKMVMRGSSGSSGTLGVSGGNLVVVAPRPGFFFGTVRKPDGQEHFTYLILFRYGRPRSDANRGFDFHCTSDGRKAETNDRIDLNGKRIEAVYHIELNERGDAIANESLTVGGKTTDMASGQVFLIDTTAETPAYEQKNVELPAIPSKLESTEDVERLAEKIRKHLENQDPDIKAFMQ